MTHLVFELRTSTPGALLPALAERVEENGYRSLWVNHPPGQPGELPRLLGPWRDTVDEVVLVPVRADQARPARDLVDAAIAGF